MKQYLKFFGILLLAAILFVFSRFTSPQAYVTSPRIDTVTIATGLEVPWEIAWGPDNKIWIAEQKGLVSRIDPKSGKKELLLQLDSVWALRTAGLLGMALHTDMKQYPYVFLNYTFMSNGKPKSRLVRYTWKGNSLSDPLKLLEIPAANGHSGSRIAVHQGKVYWATGDAQDNTFAQDPQSLNGKILRMNIDGGVPTDNPIKGSLVWAMGFPNIQGMVFSPKGLLYTSEHGDATDDELNLIQATKNYGWPAVQGKGRNEQELNYKKTHQTIDPLMAWTPTIAPAGLDFYTSDRITGWKNKLLMVNLKDKSLRVLGTDVSGKTITSDEVLFKGMFGRLRDICISPEGDVYISTSNRDWNRTMGDPLPQDDRIIRVFSSPKSSKSFVPTSQTLADASQGMKLYTQYCSSCHGARGEGLAGVFPSLQTSKVPIDAAKLVQKILQGTTGASTYPSQMPAFSFLKDAEVADIANFVRKLSGNSGGDVTASTISELRK